MSTVGLTALLVLAWLQYRWIGDLSRAEQERQQAHLRTALASIRNEVEAQTIRSIGPLVSGALPARDPLGTLSETHARWVESVATRNLVSAYYFFDGKQLYQFDPQESEPQAVNWPPGLESLRQRLEQTNDDLRQGRPTPGPEPDRLVLVIPRFHVPRAEGAAGGPVFLGGSIVQLDEKYLSQELLPNILRQYLPNGFRVRVVTRGTPERVLYSTGDSWSAPDASEPLLSLRAPVFRGRGFGPGGPGFRGPGGDGFGRGRFRRFDGKGPPFEGKRPPGDGKRPPLDGKQGPGGEPPFPFGPGPSLRDEAALWRVDVKSEAGSLEAAVEQTRRRNLAISFGVLLVALLAVGAVLIYLREAQKLMALEMEFVAGVSHELRTPLAVIGSMSQNLADGVVNNPAQVKKYGGLIASEGKRLTRMVEEILRFASLQAGRTKYQFGAVPVDEVLEQAIEAAQPELTAAGMTVERHFDESTPPALADQAALVHAFRNLIANAAKHASTGQRVELTVRPAQQGSKAEVEVEVKDFGPGIPATERAQVFDPFFRGEQSRTQQVRGFGLGLALVKRILDAHHGRIQVASEPGAGATFTVRLPAAADA
jgi:signal transduction histidine kinase